MEAAEFHRFVEAVECLTLAQRTALRTALDHGGAAVRERILEVRARERPNCVHCGSVRVINWGKALGLPRYRCKECGRTFNPLTGTSLSGLKKRDRWARHAELLRRGDVLREVADACGVHISTAHRWRHRFLAAATGQGPQISGIIEVDETWVRRSTKGQATLRRTLGRPARRRGSDQHVRGRSREQSYVVVARDRTGNTWDGVVEHVGVTQITLLLSHRVAEDSVLCSDGWPAYHGASAKLGVKHEVLRGRHERRRGPFHLQNVNNYHGRWKSWMHRFRGVATTYLPNYVAWFRHLDASKENSNSKLMLDLALTG